MRLLFLLITLFFAHYLSSKDEASFHEQLIHQTRFKVILPDNSYYSGIYRSSGLGRQGLEEVSRYLVKNELKPISHILYLHYETEKSYPFWKKIYLNLTGQLYVDDFYIEETKEAKAKGLSYRAIYFDPRLRNTDAFYSILKSILVGDKDQKAILFHCRGGRHRSGIMGRALREIQGDLWTKPYSPAKTLTLNLKPSFGMEVLFPKKKTQVVLNQADEEYYSLGGNNSLYLENVKALFLQPRFRCLKNVFSKYLRAQSKVLTETLTQERKLKLWLDCQADRDRAIRSSPVD